VTDLWNVGGPWSEDLLKVILFPLNDDCMTSIATLLKVAIVPLKGNCMISRASGGYQRTRLGGPGLLCIGCNPLLIIIVAAIRVGPIVVDLRDVLPTAGVQHGHPPRGTHIQ